MDVVLQSSRNRIFSFGIVRDFTFPRWKRLHMVLSLCFFLLMFNYSINDNVRIQRIFSRMHKRWNWVRFIYLFGKNFNFETVSMKHNLILWSKFHDSREVQLVSARRRWFSIQNLKITRSTTITRQSWNLVSMSLNSYENITMRIFEVNFLINVLRTTGELRWQNIKCAK